MLNLAIFSLFRDIAWHLPAYIEQVDALEWDGPKRVYGTENDSEDDTWRIISEAGAARGWRLFTFKTGRRRFGSIQHPLRFETLAKAGNMALDAIAADHWADAVLFIDSDFRWSPDLAVRLWAHGKDMCAPYPMANGGRFGRFFYDTWGFSYKGRAFRQVAPYHPLLRHATLHPLDTAGACIMMKAAVVYAGARLSTDAAIKGFCRSAQSLGFELWADATVEIEHCYSWQFQSYEEALRARR